MNHPALGAFIAQIRNELVVAQVLVRRQGTRFELRHVADRSHGPSGLKNQRVDQLRQLAQFTSEGKFRPLKSAPNLPSGWQCNVRDAVQLETALNHLYPGAIADWHATQSPKPPVTHYREFTDRQTGMYRITQKLSDAQAGEMIRACCDKRFCLKQRLWTVKGLAPDSAPPKSLIPCLEPCALLLEFARKIMRIEQEAKVRLELAPSELHTIVSALQRELDRPDPEIQEAEMNAPLNPRRIQRLIRGLETKVRSPGTATATANDPPES